MMDNRFYTTRSFGLNVIFVLMVLVLSFLIDFAHIGKTSREATRPEFIFCFIIFNITCILAYKNLKKRSIAYGTWFFFLLFCLFGYWDTDYFSFGQDFIFGLEDFRDILYPYICEVSLDNYTLFRFFIWGSALFIFFKTLKRLGLNPNIAIYILCLLYLELFSYPRAILAMALYYCGFVELIYKRKKSMGHLFKALMFFALAYCAHRSIAVLILFTPIGYMKLSKKIIKLSLIFSPVFLWGLYQFFIFFLNSNGSSDVFMAASQYAKYNVALETNWKFALIRNLINIGLYIPLVYLVWKVYFKDLYKVVDPYILKLLNFSIALALFASLFLIMGKESLGLDVIGYRYLFMLGFPLVIMLTYLYQNRLIKFKKLNLLLICELIASEGFLLGKLMYSNVVG